MDPSTKFGLYTKTDDATHTPRGYEKFYYSEESRPLKQAQILLKRERKSLGFSCVREWSQNDGFHSRDGG